MQSRRFTKLAMLAIVGLWASTLVGCSGRYTGGGFIDSAAGAPAKATFGFTFEGVDDGSGLCIILQDPDGETYGWGKGHATYQDHGTGVKFRFDCDKVGVIMNWDTFEPTGWFYYGPYTSQAGNGDFVSFVVTSNGDPLDSSDDTIRVFVGDGPFGGYSNSGTLQGGNVSWHPPKSSN